MTGSMLYLNRARQCLDDATPGELLVPEQRLDAKWILRKFASLEPRWASNERSISCIPDGTYRLVKKTGGRYGRRYAKDFGHAFVPEIADVPGRTAILLHIGNWASPPPARSDSEGCVLVGYPDDRRNRGRTPMILNSADAYKKFHALLVALYQIHPALTIRVRTFGDAKCLV